MDGTGRRIADLRRRRGYTQAELGRAVGVSTDTIRSWEHGRRGVSERRLRALADALDVDPNTLLGWQP